MAWTEEDYPAPNPSGLCMCGCGGVTALAAHSRPRDGILVGHHQRYIHGHHTRTWYGKCDSTKPQYSIDENGCWVWNHGHSGKYGKLEGDYAHRVFYRRRYGPIPKGMVIDHLCFNQLCVNPDHLEAVSDSENKRRAMARRYRGLAPVYPKMKLS